MLIRESHILDIPAPISDLRLMCGRPVSAASRKDVIAPHTALATCISCLRAYSLKLECQVKRLEYQLETANRPVQGETITATVTPLEGSDA